MTARRFLSCLLAVLMVCSLIPIGQAQADSDWSSQFESFVMNQEYLQSGLSFNSDAYIQPRFSLYDLDQNGEPELIAFNGGPSLAASTDYVFTHEAWGANYIGNIGYRGCELYYYEGSAYPGLFCSDGNNGVVRTTYYELRDGSIVSQDLQEIGADVDGTQRILPFFTLDEIRSMGWNAFLEATFGMPVDIGADSHNTSNDSYEDNGEIYNYADNEVDVIPVGEQFAANIFLSNFSEQHAFERAVFSADSPLIDDIVSFAYLYCKINRREMLSTAQVGDSYYYTLSLENANTVLKRHFDISLSEADAARFPENQDPSSRFHSFYENSTFYFPAADGESYNRLTVVSHIDPPEPGDVRYQMYFDIYELDIQEYMNANGAVDSGYYYLSSSQAANDSRLTWVNSGVALVKPYNNNGTDTYQLLYYRVEEKKPDPDAPKSSVTRRIYTKADAYRSSDPRDNKGGCMNLGGNYEEFLWGNYLFETPSRQLSGQSLSNIKSPLYNLAMLCGSLCIDSYHPDYLVQAYRDIGIEKNDIFLYSYKNSPYNRKNAKYNGNDFANDDVLAFSIATMPMIFNNTDTDIVFVTIRGTLVREEYTNDAFSLCDHDFYGYPAWDIVWQFEEEFFAGLDDYRNEHPELGTRPMKFVISGHSLGGAAANLIAARLNIESGNENEWFGRAITYDDIYCFTFGAIDSLVNIEAMKKTVEKTRRSGTEGRYEKYMEEFILKFPLGGMKFPVSEGYENILNIYNLLDTFGPYQMGYKLPIVDIYVSARGNSGYGKFGCFLSFTDSMKSRFPDSDCPSHEIVGYVHAVKDGQPSLDPEFGKKIIVACPVDVEVLHNEDTVCRIVSDQIVSSADNIAACVENGTKVILVPENMDYQLRLTATDSGTMDYYVSDLTGSNDITLFVDVPLTAGLTFSSEINGDKELSDVKLYALNSDSSPESEVRPDGTVVAIEAGETSSPSETEIKEDGSSALPEETKQWMIVAVVALTVGIICLVILFTTRRKKPARKSEEKTPSGHVQEKPLLPAFSETHCCICGNRLDEDYWVFFHTKDGQEARLDDACYKQLYILRESEDEKEIKEARRYVRSRYDEVDPLVSSKLRKLVKMANDYLSGNKE